MKPLSFRLATIGVVALAAFLRLFRLDFWHQLLFDENYYVKDAISIRLFGAELAWPKSASDALALGTLPQPLAKPELISHPPLGKILISLGFDLFGPTNPWGWRFSSAVAGILSVLLAIFISNIVFANKRIALLAGFLMAIDGTAIALSRVAMLDSFLTMFVLLAFWSYLEAHVSNRPKLWLLITGLSLGAATAVKWSGLWFAVAITVHALVRTKQRWQTFVWLAIGGTLSYLISWSLWFSSSNGYDRSFGGNPLFALVKLHVDMFNYNLHYRSSNSSVTSAWGWPILWQPTVFAVDAHSKADASCGTELGCKLLVSTLGNPLIWWGGTVALLMLLVGILSRREKNGELILLGAVAGWLPWLIADRSSFQFYAVVIDGFWCMALAWLIAKAGARRMAIFASVAALVSFIFLPYQFGSAQPDWYWQVTRVLPHWQ